MRFKVKLYPRSLPGEVKVSEIRSQKAVVEMPDEMSEAEARRALIDDLHGKGAFIKKIERMEAHA